MVIKMNLTKMIFVVLLIFTGSVCAKNTSDYYTNPQSPGRHFDCKQEQKLENGTVIPATAVAYENNEILILCDGFTLTSTKKHFWSHKIYFVNAPSILVKSDDEEQMPQEQAQQIINDTFSTPFYDSAERKQVSFLGASLIFDASTTLIGIHVGNCTEGNPIVRHFPVLSTVVVAWSWYDIRLTAKNTPRFFTTSKEMAPWVAGSLHTAAGISNLLTCVL